MTAMRHDHLSQMKSVNKLLEIAEMKHYLQEMQAEKAQQFTPQLHGKEPPHNFRYKPTTKHQSVSLQRYHQQKQRQSIFESTDGSPDHMQKEWDQHIQQRSSFNKIEEESREDLSSARLPHVGRQDKIFSLNSTFHVQNPSKYAKKQNQIAQSYRYIRGDELSAVFATHKQPKTKNNVVYLKPNKSQTIRQLLNQMKVEKTKNSKIELNGMLHNFSDVQFRNDSILFSANQLKQLKKYKNFMPFREDERLLIQKIGERQSIWKRKFKQSWQKRKIQHEGRRSNLKSILKK